MASSTMQCHAEALRQAVTDFRGEELSLSSVERLCDQVERIAHRMAAPRPVTVRAARLRAVKGGG